MADNNDSTSQSKAACRKPALKKIKLEVDGEVVAKQVKHTPNHQMRYLFAAAGVPGCVAKFEPEERSSQKPPE